MSLAKDWFAILEPVYDLTGRALFGASSLTTDRKQVQKTFRIIIAHHDLGIVSFRTVALLMVFAMIFQTPLKFS